MCDFVRFILNMVYDRTYIEAQFILENVQK